MDMDWIEILRVQREKEVTTLRDLIDWARPQREERTVVSEYACKSFKHNDGEITRLRVSQTTFDDHSDDYVDVQAYYHPLTKAGKRHATKSAYWISLPSEVASTIIAVSIAVSRTGE